MKVTAVRIKGYELEPGDLFSTRGQDYWDSFPKHQSIGESVYIRTETPADASPDSDSFIYRIIIQK